MNNFRYILRYKIDPKFNANDRIGKIILLAQVFQEVFVFSFESDLMSCFFLH